MSGSAPLAFVRLPEWALLPDFGLYMDQLLLFTGRVFPDGMLNPPLTPGMVNSYVKHGLIDRPQGKKYSRGSLAQLLMLCCLKQTSSMDSMKRLLHPAEASGTEALYGRFRQELRRLSDSLCLDSGMTALDCALASAVYQQACSLRMDAGSAPQTQPSDPTPTNSGEEAT